MSGSTFFLIRHGLCDSVGKRIAGRAPGVHLNAEGREQASRLAARLCEFALHAIYSSPLERTRETAEPLALAKNLDVCLDDAFLEIDYGEWTGKSFDELASVSEWRQYNAFRSGRRIPGGEAMVAVQARAVAELMRLGEQHPGESVAVFTHADVIRAVLLYFLGSSVEFNLRLEISPASVSVLELTEWDAKLIRVNDV